MSDICQELGISRQAHYQMWQRLAVATRRTDALSHDLSELKEEFETTAGALRQERDDLLTRTGNLRAEKQRLGPEMAFRPV